MNVALSGPVNRDSNTAPFIPSPFNNFCSLSVVLQPLLFIAISDRNHPVFLMALISQYIKDLFLSQGPRLSSLCIT